MRYSMYFIDPIFTFRLGVGGTAIAAIIGQFISFCILLSMYLRGKSMLKLSIKRVTFGDGMYKEILKIGFPSFLRIGLNSLAIITMNFSAGAFGDAAIAAMSVHTRIVMFCNSALIGLGQGTVRLPASTTARNGLTVFGRVSGSLLPPLSSGCQYSQYYCLYSPRI